MALKSLCVGINDYPGTGSDLNGCVNDALDWAAELGRRGFETTTLLNQQATGAEIRSRLTRLVSGAAPGDTIVVQFSGHGSYVPDSNGDEPDGRDECLCPSDFARGYITDDELYALFAARKTGVRIALIADSCHSGTIGKAGRSEATRKVRCLPPATLLANRAAQTSGAPEVAPYGAAIGSRARRARQATLTLSGCQDSQYSYDDFFGSRPNGAFSYAALDTLRSLPKGATYRQWHAAIRKKLPSLEYPQTPMLHGPTAMKDLPAFEP